MPKKRKNYQRKDAQLMREFLEQGRVLAEWDLIIKKFIYSKKNKTIFLLLFPILFL